MRRWTGLCFLPLVGLLALGGGAEAAKKKPRSTARSKPAAPAPSVPQVTPLPVETAGPDELVRGVVIAGPGIAGAVLWPPARVLEGSDLPPGTALIAARLAVETACAGEPGARPIVALFGEGIGVGAALDSGDASALGRILARLAFPPGSSATWRRADLDRLQARAAEYWEDPRAVSRRVALGMLFPGRREPWDGYPGPQAVADADPEEIATAVSRVGAAAVRYLVAGPSGTSGRIVAGLRPGPLDTPAADAPVPAPRLPAAAIVEEEGAAQGDEDDSVGLAIAFRLAGLDRRTLDSSLPVLAEALREGQGSLAQRLQVVLGEPASAQVELLHGKGEVGALVLSTRVPAPSASIAWRVLAGSISSVQTIPLREDALYRARRRLAEDALRRRQDATAVLLEEFGGLTAVLGVPREAIKANELMIAAQRALTADRRASAAAGPVDDETVAAPEFESAIRLGWDRFDPASEAMLRTDLEEIGAAAAIALAREGLLALAEGRAATLDPHFRATYRVRETTPAGPVESTLRVTAATDAISLTVEGRDWKLEAQERVGEAGLPSEGVLHLPHTNRLLALSLREPAILLASILAGGLPAAAVTADCGRSACPALRTELTDGSVLTLALDPERKLPRLLQIRWPGKEGGDPDETVRYLGWRLAGGVQVAAEMAVDDALGTTREVKLVDWDSP